VRYTLAACCALLVGLTGCGDDEPTTPAGCVDYSAVSGTPSFADDVMPIFQTTCNFSSCHGTNATSPQEGLLLGPPSTDTATQEQIDDVHAGIVGQAASQSSLSLVSTGDPAASYLMVKVDYADISGGCATNGCSSGCGTQMPPADALANGDATTLRQWIASGAPNN